MMLQGKNKSIPFAHLTYNTSTYTLHKSELLSALYIQKNKIFDYFML